METIGIFEADNLAAGGFPEIRDTRIIPAATAIKRGDILGADFKPIKDEGTVDSIALQNLDASATIRTIVVAESGIFNANELGTGDTTTAMDWKQDLRKLSIYVRQPAP